MVNTIVQTLKLAKRSENVPYLPNSASREQEQAKIGIPPKLRPQS